MAEHLTPTARPRRRSAWQRALPSCAGALQLRALLTVAGQSAPGHTRASKVAGIRVWFVRDLLQAIERERGALETHAVVQRLSAHLAERLQTESLKRSLPTDTMPIGDVEEVLLSLDSALGDGSGRVLEGAASDIAMRQIAQDGGLAVPGDLFGTVARLRTFLEHPFVDMPLGFELAPTETGFSLTVGVTGRPRSARIMRNVVTGVIRAAQRYCRESTPEELKLYGEMMGDRARVSARYRTATPESPPATPSRPPFARRASSTSVRAIAQRSLAQEVDRILGQSSRPPAVSSSAPPRRVSDPPAPLTTNDKPPPSSRRRR